MQRAPKAICLNRQEGAANTDLVHPQAEKRKDNSPVKYAAPVQHIWFNINTHRVERMALFSKQRVCQQKTGQSCLSPVQQGKCFCRKHVTETFTRARRIHLTQGAHFPSCQVMQTNIKFVLIENRHERVALEHRPEEVSRSGARGFLPSDRPLGAARRNHN